MDIVAVDLAAEDAAARALLRARPPHLNQLRRRKTRNLGLPTRHTLPLVVAVAVDEEGAA